MNPLALLLVFSCGVSVGLLWGRADERKKAAARTELAPLPPVVVPPVAAPAAKPAAEDAPAVPVVTAVPVGPDAPVEPAVTRALRGDVLEPPPPPRVEITKKGKKLGFDERTFTPSDDILDRLRRAEELGVDTEAAQELLGNEPRPPAVARPAPIDPTLAEKERRILERLRAQQPEGEPDG